MFLQHIYYQFQREQLAIWTLYICNILMLLFAGNQIHKRKNAITLFKKLTTTCLYLMIFIVPNNHKS